MICDFIHGMLYFVTYNENKHWKTIFHFQTKVHMFNLILMLYNTLNCYIKYTFNFDYNKTKPLKLTKNLICNLYNYLIINQIFKISSLIIFDCELV